MNDDPRHFCLDCGYPLDQLPKARCPECGRTFDPDDPATFVELAGTPVRVYVTSESAEAETLRAALHDAGIFAVVMGAGLAAGIGIGTSAVGVSLWVGADQAERAQRIIEETMRRGGTADPGASWTCPGCDEEIEGQFAACWSCGAARPAAADD